LDCSSKNDAPSAPLDDTAMICAVSRARYLMRLTGEFALYTGVNRIWWIPPLLLLFATALLVIVVGQAAAPYALYPVF
jgi:hypothetical protein